jgi:hypothetical protein
MEQYSLSNTLNIEFSFYLFFMLSSVTIQFVKYTNMSFKMFITPNFSKKKLLQPLIPRLLALEVKSPSCHSNLANGFNLSLPGLRIEPEIV